jgi:hypothetical protein
LYVVGNVNIPHYWIRPQQILSSQKGSHRFVWDLHYTPLNVAPSYPIAAIYKNTAPNKTSPWVMPGRYIVRLTVDGKVYNQLLEVKMDPRVKTSAAELLSQSNLSNDCYNARKEIMGLTAGISDLRAQIKLLQGKAQGDVSSSLKQADDLLGKLQGIPGNNLAPGLPGTERAFASLFNTLQESDMPPTTQVVIAVKEAKASYAQLKQQWSAIKSKTIPDLNKQLATAGLNTLVIK